MDMVAFFKRLLVYDDWANHEIVSVMRKTGTPPRSLRFLAHIVAAESLWLVRLRQEKKSGPVWPELSLEQCEQEINRLAEAWREYAASLTPQLLGERRAYTNSKGEPWESTVEDILTHVIMHSAYHRGQIATDTRAAGHDPAYTDFIHATRTGLIE